MTADSTQFAEKAGAGHDDLELVRAAQNGDVSAFEQLVKRYDRQLFRIVQSFTHNTQDSQDVVQEAFFKAFQNLGQFRGESRFSTWLISIAVNQARMKLRKQRASREVFLEDDQQADVQVFPIEVVDWSPNPEQLYWASELRDILRNAIGGLPPILRAVFVLRDIEGLSIDQTAEVLNVSQPAVKARLWRARLQVRERLNKYLSSELQTARIREVPSWGQTSRIVGLVSECLDHTSARTGNPALAESPLGTPPKFNERPLEQVASARL